MKKPVIEKYVFTEPKRFWKGVPHTDSCRFVADNDIVEDDEEVLYDKVMDENEYVHTIEANCEPSYGENSVWGEPFPKAGIRVIVVVKK